MRFGARAPLRRLRVAAIDGQKDNASVSGAMLSPLLTEAIEPARNTAKACCPSRVHHAFGVSWVLWRNCEGAPKTWHPALALCSEDCASRPTVMRRISSLLETDSR